MDTRRSRCAALAVLLVPIWVAGCSDRDLGLQSPTAPLSTDALRLSADPSVLVPQFLSREDCPVRPAFRGLPSRAQVLLNLLLGDGAASYREISEELGMPIGSIGPTRQRCLDRLRTLVEAEDAELLVGAVA